MNIRLAMIPIVLAAVLPTTTEASRLDQAYVPDSNPILSATVGFIGNGQKAEQAQTFRVGVGGRLTEVDVDLRTSFGPPSGLLLEIRRTTPDGLPSDAASDLIGAASLPPGPSHVDYRLVRFALGENAPDVTPGQQLAIVLKTPGAGSFDWGGGVGDPYLPGRMASRGPSYHELWGPQDPLETHGDLGFQTRVEPVPEPSSLAILALGGAALIVIRGRLSA